MRKKQPVSCAQNFPHADPFAVKLLEGLLEFDPKGRQTIEEIKLNHRKLLDGMLSRNVGQNYMQ